MVYAMWGMSDQPILMLSQVRAWQARQREIETDIQALQAEAKDIERRLEAVRVLLGSLPDEDDPETQDGVNTGRGGQTSEEIHSSASFMDSVLIAVAKLGGLSSPGEIRTWLREHGSTPAIRMQAEKPYFYAVIMRQARAGRLIKVGDRYRLPTSSPQGETGGVWPPADSVT
jgi:hypothetical protein